MRLVLIAKDAFLLYVKLDDGREVCLGAFSLHAESVNGRQA